MLVSAMTPSPRNRMKPEWANLPRRNCADCGKSYKPKRPLRSIDQYGFCSPTCKKSFHKHGGAYRKLKGEVRKMVEKEFAHISAELKELRALWIETESRFVQLSSRIDSVFALRNLRSAPIPPALQPASAKADGRRIPTRNHD
jgi:hypothetical protein